MSERVTIVTMVGLLVAMLGSTAEAHYIMVKGKLKWHSLNCVMDFKEVPSPDLNPAEVECVAEPKLVEILCVDDPVKTTQRQVVQVNLSKTPVTLVAKKRIDQNDMTDTTNAHVEVIISDEPFLNFGVCEALNLIAIDVLIRNYTSVKIKTYGCVGPDPDPCLQKVLASTFSVAGYTLPNKFNLVNYPKNLPIYNVTSYAGPGPTIKHMY
jgi:hypothetical protein